MDLNPILILYILYFRNSIDKGLTIQIMVARSKQSIEMILMTFGQTWIQIVKATREKGNCQMMEIGITNLMIETEII